MAKKYTLMDKEAIDELCKAVRESHSVSEAIDDDNLAINIFFSEERREENVESILAKIKAYEDYEQSIKNKKLDISDEEFVRMALGNVPDMDKAIDSLKGNSQNKDGANFFV